MFAHKQIVGTTVKTIKKSLLEKENKKFIVFRIIL